MLIALAGLAFVTLMMAFPGGTPFLLLHLFVDAVLLAYVVAIVQYQREVEAARLRTHPLAPARAPRTTLVASGTAGHRTR